MKKVLMLNYEFPPLGGGAANACYHLLKELAKKKIAVDLVTSSATGNYERVQFSKHIVIHKLGIPKKNIHYWKMSELFIWSVKAYRFVGTLKPYDMVHCFFGWPCGVIAYMQGMRYVVSLRGSDVPGFNARLRVLDALVFSWLSRMVWRKAVHVVANSEGLRRLALRSSPKQKITVIENGVDTALFKPKRTKSSKVIVSVGRLIPRKGYQYLIPALSGLGYELWLIGDGVMKQELRSLARKYGVRVVFLGEQKHAAVVGYLQKADLFVLPSLHEGMSNALLEAMGCGLPVVVTSVGGSAELVRGNGFVVAPRSVGALRTVIEKYDSSLLKKHGAVSRKIALTKSWRSVAEEYEKLYL